MYFRLNAPGEGPFSSSYQICYFVMYTIKKTGVTVFIRDTLFKCNLHLVGAVTTEENVTSEKSLYPRRKLYLRSSHREERCIRVTVISERSIISEKSWRKMLYLGVPYIREDRHIRGIFSSVRNPYIWGIVIS